MQERMGRSETFKARQLWAALETSGALCGLTSTQRAALCCLRDSKLLVSSDHHSGGVTIRHKEATSLQILPYRSPVHFRHSVSAAFALFCKSTESQLCTSDTCGVSDFSNSTWTSFSVQKGLKLFLSPALDTSVFLSKIFYLIVIFFSMEFLNHFFLGFFSLGKGQPELCIRAQTC